MIKLKVKLLSPRASAPEYATDGAAAMDLRALVDSPVVIAPGGSALIPTGIAIELPDPGYAAFVFARSGLAVKRGISLRNGVGVIDSDYRGEVCVGLQNLSDEPYTVNDGDRVAQLCVMPVERAEIVVASALGDTVRGDGGFGSTGK